MNPLADPPGLSAAKPSPSRSDRERNSRFDEVFQRLAPRVRGYARRFTKGDSDEAEDVTQEVFLAAYLGGASYRGSAPPLAWLLGIARRRWRDRNRGLRGETVTLPEDAVASDDPAEQTIRAQHLRACLAQLTAEERDALRLVFGQGLTYADYAVDLHLSTRTLTDQAESTPAPTPDQLSQLPLYARATYANLHTQSHSTPETYWAIADPKAEMDRKRGEWAHVLQYGKFEGYGHFVVRDSAGKVVMTLDVTRPHRKPGLTLDSGDVMIKKQKVVPGWDGEE